MLGSGYNKLTFKNILSQKTDELYSTMILLAIAAKRNINLIIKITRYIFLNKIINIEAVYT